ncbi:MAG: tRNA glutamyl-Q(34) synthetase GluQRS [Alphaproteobacteria bacterium]|nr:tRNA glutamyl-Q(34) synthetase GluQRS [Alphaproteobacteria bacterium]
MTVTRFAPSPTGRLHLGHAFSALFAQRAAHAAGGRFLLRIEDTDRGRCRPEFEAGIYEDLAWLGLDWEKPVRRQSEHMADYAAALARLEGMGLLYKCFCTRAEIMREIEAAGGAPHESGALYPGTCRHRAADDVATRVASGAPYALRLDVRKALEVTGPLEWIDRAAGRQRAAPERLGDVVLARKEFPASYHLAVVHDDRLQQIDLVTRGVDLFEATHIHRLLQALLGYAAPAYWHHRLVLDEKGQRLAKRAGGMALKELREAGKTAASILKELDF